MKKKWKRKANLEGLRGEERLVGNTGQIWANGERRVIVARHVPEAPLRNTPPSGVSPPAVPREQKMLKKHIPRVIYPQAN